jgi:hypothetical protein
MRFPSHVLVLGSAVMLCAPSLLPCRPAHLRQPPLIGAFSAGQKPYAAGGAAKTPRSAVRRPLVLCLRIAGGGEEGQREEGAGDAQPGLGIHGTCSNETGVGITGGLYTAAHVSSGCGSAGNLLPQPSSPRAASRLALSGYLLLRPSSWCLERQCAAGERAKQLISGEKQLRRTPRPPEHGSSPHFPP